MKNKSRELTVVVAKSNLKLLAIYYDSDTDKSVNELILDNLQYYGLTVTKTAKGKKLIKCSDKLFAELKKNFGRYSFYEEYELDWSVKDGIPITSVAVEVKGKWYLKSEMEEDRQNRIMFMWKYEFPSKEDFLSLNAKNQNELLYDIVRGLCERHGFPKS